jgi:catechol 2,3-dioxygenase-like lactoylglutathione lyase family enzyme
MHHQGVWVLLQDGRSGQRLGLNRYPPGSPFATPYVPGKGLDHIGYSTSHAAANIRKLVAHGGRLVLPPTDPNDSRETMYVADPDGNWVEIRG